MRMRALVLATTLTAAGLAAPGRAAGSARRGRPGRGRLRHGRQPLQRPERQRSGAPGPAGPARGAPARRHLARMRPQLLRHPAPRDRRFLAQPRRRRGRQRRRPRLPPVQVVSAHRQSPRDARRARRGCRDRGPSARSRPSSRAGGGRPTGGPSRGRAAAGRRGCGACASIRRGMPAGLLTMISAVVGRTSMLVGSLASSSTRLCAALPISLWNSASSSATAAGSCCSLRVLATLAASSARSLLRGVVHGLIDGGRLQRARGVPQLAERHLLQDQRARHAAGEAVVVRHGHRQPPARLARDQARLLEQADALAHGRAVDAELAHQLRLGADRIAGLAGGRPGSCARSPRPPARRPAAA